MSNDFTALVLGLMSIIAIAGLATGVWVMVFAMLEWR